MIVVLFCGGQGIRLRADAPGIPKPMVSIGSQPILAHLMRWYAHHGHREFVLCLGAGGETIVRHFLACQERVAAEMCPGAITRIRLRMDDLGDWAVTLVPTGATASVGQRLRAVRRHVMDRPFLANYADGLSDLDLPGFLARFEASGALAGLISVRHPGSFHVVSTGRDGRVARVVAIGDSEVRINGGFFVFRPEVFDWLAPGDDLADGLLPRLVSAGALFAHVHDGFWACLDTVKDWHALEELDAAGRGPWKPWLGVTSEPSAGTGTSPG